MLRRDGFTGAGAVVRSGKSRKDVALNDQPEQKADEHPWLTALLVAAALLFTAWHVGVFVSAVAGEPEPERKNKVQMLGEIFAEH